MEQSSDQEISSPSKLEIHVSKKSRFLLWIWFLMTISIFIIIIFFIIFIRIQSVFFVLDDKPNIETTIISQRSTRATRVKLMSTEMITSKPSNISRVIPCNPLKFSKYSSYSTGRTPWSFSSGHLDEDPYLDIVVVSRSGARFGLYYGIGNGTFQPEKVYDSYQYPVYVAVKDINHDDKSDIIIPFSGIDTIGIFINRGSRIFSPIEKHYTGYYRIDYYPYWIDISDFNHNSLLDAVVVNGHDASVSIFYDYSNSNFTYTKIYPTGHDGIAVSIADFDNDTYEDFAVTDYSDNTISVYINDKNGFFKRRKKYLAGIAPWGMTTADLNNDQFVDIIVANHGSSRVSVSFNDGQGHFYKRDTYCIGGTPKAVAVADLNNDSFMDIIASNYKDNFIYIFLNNQDGTFLPYQTFKTDPEILAITTGDFNLDGKIDIAVTSEGEDTLNILLNLC
ncbi:unnamed protein product [Adineta ricciae]|uniref:VCBS repeat-containing protein n=2 Tax=Adineta ricciae TaxID=249248 RepID=A0A815HMQ0_ADIRI|nr:unnamed protein product [Adineta ricciae]